MTTSTTERLYCTGCGRGFQGKVGLGVHLSMSKTCGTNATVPTLRFRSGATRQTNIDPARVVGLDRDGRILVNDFAKGEDGWLFGLTLCCNASDKGTETGIACRGCYGTDDVGEYYYASHYPNYEGVIADPIVREGEEPEPAPVVSVETGKQVVQTSCTECGRFHGGECPPAPTTATLPHTGYVVPAEAATLRVKITGRMDTSDGEAFTAEVYDGKRLRGIIEQLGHGGGTDFRHATFEDMKWFDALANEYAAIDEDHRFVAHESLLNDLYEEAALYRDMNRKRNAVILVSEIAGTVVKAGGEIVEADIRMLNRPLDDKSREWIRGQFPTAKVWIKSKGWVQA